MKILFMGTPSFAVPALQQCARHHEVAAVITQPDRPSGRGKKLKMPEVKQAALALGLQVLQFEDINSAEALETLQALRCDVAVVAAFGQILSSPILEMPRLGSLNIHASLLPRWRGASPIQSAIASGDRQSGITIMKMARTLDTGDIVYQQAVAIDDQMTGGALHDILSQMGAQAIAEVLSDLADFLESARPQDDDQASYAPLISKAMTKIDWRADAEQIYNLIRAYYPWPLAATAYQAHHWKVISAQRSAKSSSAPAGTIIELSDNAIEVACGKGVLALTAIKPANAKQMTVAAYLRGHQVQMGSQLG